MPLLVDTGFLYALADSDDAWHIRSRRYLSRIRDMLLAPVTVLPEVAYLLRHRLGPPAEQRFTHSLVAGEIDIQELSHADMKRIEEILNQYEDIGFVDASVAAIAERLRIPVLATTDRRHFTQIRLKHVDVLELVP